MEKNLPPKIMISQMIFGLVLIGGWVASWLVPMFAIGGIFVALPWIILHYVTKWKTAATLTNDDEALLEAAPALGGRARTTWHEGRPVDRGFQVLNPAYPAVRASVDVADDGIAVYVRDRGSGFDPAAATGGSAAVETVAAAAEAGKSTFEGNEIAELSADTPELAKQVLQPCR